MRFKPRSILIIPRAADHSATSAVMDRMVPGDLMYKSSTMPMTRESSIFGMIRTRIASRSDLFMAGINWISVNKSMINGKNAITIKKDACAA